ncbi:large-conductance mechanosensitive channel protein MscL [Daejeonella sp.]|uniref:large-conductance mechanosensitive channel protein MscL n=1 Tax=Daejeonella sp. TaxID=2805397 RepID=UPI0039831BAD
MSFIKEFREFISKGNVIDLAVGVVIGASFGRIITSLVDDIIMPQIGYFFGGVDFADRKIILVPADTVNKIQEVAVRYGNFINTLIQFLVVALCIFALVKVINTLRRKEDAVPAAPPLPSKEEMLLSEIRDILRNQRG